MLVACIKQVGLGATNRVIASRWQYRDWVWRRMGPGMVHLDNMILSRLLLHGRWELSTHWQWPRDVLDSVTTSLEVGFRVFFCETISNYKCALNINMALAAPLKQRYGRIQYNVILMHRIVHTSGYEWGQTGKVGIKQPDRKITGEEPRASHSDTDGNWDASKTALGMICQRLDIAIQCMYHNGATWNAHFLLVWLVNAWSCLGSQQYSF